MQILKSLFLGSEGSFNFLGVPVEFKPLTPPPDLPVFILPIPQIARKCIRFLFLADVHTFSHQMSHALAHRLLLKEAVKVIMATNMFAGTREEYSEAYDEAPLSKKAIIALAGPIGHMAFATCQLIGAIALKSLLPWPVVLALEVGAVSFMIQELGAAIFESVMKMEGSDFYEILELQGVAGFALASTLLVSQFALGLFAAYRLSR